MSDNPPPALALLRFGMNSPDSRQLARFYEQAFGARLMASADTGRTMLGLGDATIELWEHAQPGRPYPQELSPYDTRFQHLAIVVINIRLAMERLQQTPGWTAISIDGPQRLPDSAGGVTAFKFRDPDGHPLEFLQFGAGRVPMRWQAAPGDPIHQGIDHSALSVADTQRSVRFYESLGLYSVKQTFNHGAAQERLDGVPAPRVDVISLAPQRSTPHVELLCYHTPVRPIHDAPAATDISATRMVFAVASGADGRVNLIQDPDGHYLQFE